MYLGLAVAPATWYNRSIILKEDLIMAKQHDKQFKLDAVQYYFDHKELGVRGCAQNPGVGYSTLTKWLKDFREAPTAASAASLEKLPTIMVSVVL